MENNYPIALCDIGLASYPAESKEHLQHCQRTIPKTVKIASKFKSKPIKNHEKSCLGGYGGHLGPILTANTEKVVEK